MMDYKVNGKVVNITLDTGIVVKVSTEWVEKSMKALNTDIEDVLLMFLEDNNYLINDEQVELDNKAKKVVKNVVKSETERKKVSRERKPNEVKEKIIKALVDNALQYLATDINVENAGKIVTFKIDNKEFKLDLTEKRVKKV